MAMSVVATESVASSPAGVITVGGATLADNDVLVLAVMQDKLGVGAIAGLGGFNAPHFTPDPAFTELTSAHQSGGGPVLWVGYVRWHPGDPDVWNFAVDILGGWASALSGSQGARTWDPAWSPGSGLATSSSVAVAPASGQQLRQRSKAKHVSTIPRPDGVVDGDFLLAISPGTTSIPAGWTAVITNPGSSGQGQHAIFYRVASGEPASYAFGGAIIAYVGVDPTTPISDATTSVTTGTDQAPDVVPTVANCLIAHFYVWWSVSGLHATTLPGIGGGLADAVQFDNIIANGPTNDICTWADNVRPRGDPAGIAVGLYLRETDPVVSPNGSFRGISDASSSFFAPSGAIAGSGFVDPSRKYAMITGGSMYGDEGGSWVGDAPIALDVVHGTPGGGTVGWTGKGLAIGVDFNEAADGAVADRTISGIAVPAVGNPTMWKLAFAVLFESFSDGGGIHIGVIGF